jgi:hypothetical protein
MIKHKSFRSIFLVAILFCLAFSFLFQDTFTLANSVRSRSISPVAETQSFPSPTIIANATQPIASSSDPTAIQVSDVYRSGTTEKDPERSRAAINDIITIKVENFKKYYQEVLCKDRDSSCNPKLLLNLDGRRIAGISPESLNFNKEQGILSFRLRRDSSNEEAWADLLSNPLDFSSIDRRETKASISLENGGDSTPIATSKSFNLVRFKWGHATFWVGAIGAIFISLKSQVKSGLKNLVRENGPEPENESRPYSLGRCQMAWWSFWVFISYISLYMVTGASDTLNDSILGLLGIGAGTALGAALIDRDKDNEIRKSQGFWTDILNSREQNGPGLHRLQLILWTMILTVIFIVSIFSKLSMPQFSSTLLALQGIVSGTYLGFKFPENS